MVARPDLVRKRLEEAESFFTEAAKARKGGPAGAATTLPGADVPPQPGEEVWTLGPDGKPVRE